MEAFENKQGLSRQRNLSGRLFHLTPRDCAILNLLWRWKLAPTATIHEMVGGSNTPYSTYRAMERLAEHGYVDVVVNQRYKFRAWQLNDLGFETIRESLGELKEDGFLSENQWHDRHVVAFHLGEWSKLPLPQVTLFTEQEMRRRSSDFYPDWIPQTGEHRADGYTQIAMPKKSWILAYEVELWPKSLAQYESVIRYYRMFRNLDRVYWLVDDTGVREKIRQAKTCVRDEDDHYHLFVNLKDYQHAGWDAPVSNVHSQTLFTLRENMRGMLGGLCGAYVGDMPGQPMGPVHYDPNKVLGKPRA